METNTLNGLEPLIGIEELAEYLGVPIKTLYKWRQEGTGPCSVRVGRHVRTPDPAPDVFDLGGERGQHGLFELRVRPDRFLQARPRPPDDGRVEVGPAAAI